MKMMKESTSERQNKASPPRLVKKISRVIPSLLMCTRFLYLYKKNPGF
jgi:hypothetical protein